MNKAEGLGFAMELPPFMTVSQYSEISGISAKTLKDKILSGELPVVRTGLDPDKRSSPYLNIVKMREMASAVEFNHPVLGDL